MGAAIEPLPRWVKAGFGGIGAVLVALTVWWFAFDGRLGDPQPASWRVDPAAELGPATRAVPIVVNERECASGASAEGRIIAEVTYVADAVRITVRVRQRPGGQDCQGSPGTRYVVTLSEPLGDRSIEGEDWP